MIAVVRAEDIESRRQTVAAELLRRKRVRGVVRELDPRLRREAHPGRSPTVLCTQRGPLLSVDLAAQQIQFRLPCVFGAVFFAMAAVIDVRKLQRSPLRKTGLGTRAESNRTIQM